MKGVRTFVGTALVLALTGLAVTACTRENYHPSFPEHSILNGPDRSQEWYKTNDDGK
ncbi:MAG: hypothetical protein ACM30I_00835 [Gemmatimonas sp.]